MPIYELSDTGIKRLQKTTFADRGIRERQDIQRLLRNQIEIISDQTMVIAEEFGDWDVSRRRIDLLCIDKEANLVVIELKRTEDGGHMELQAIRYSAMISTMTFDQVVEAHKAHEQRAAGKARSAALSDLERIQFGKKGRQERIREFVDRLEQKEPMELTENEQHFVRLYHKRRKDRKTTRLLKKQEKEQTVSWMRNEGTSTTIKQQQPTFNLEGLRESMNRMGLSTQKLKHVRFADP